MGISEDLPRAHEECLEVCSRMPRLHLEMCFWLQPEHHSAISVGASRPRAPPGTCRGPGCTLPGPVVRPRRTLGDAFGITRKLAGISEKLPAMFATLPKGFSGMALGMFEKVLVAAATAIIWNKGLAGALKGSPRKL